MNWEPHLVREVTDEAAGLRGYLVVDTLANCRSCGGVRIAEDVGLAEVKALARAMTLKYSFLGNTILGGAKAGICVADDCPSDRKTEILRSFGRQIAPLLAGRTFIPWTDMNAGPGEIATILRAAGVKPGRMPDSAYPTALSVFGSIQAAGRLKGLNLSGITVAIEGYGHVGAYLADELVKSGAKIVAVSTRHGAIWDQSGLDDFILHHHPDKKIEKEKLLELDVDVLVPAARPWTIHEKNAGNIQAKIIAPAANRPITDAAEETLFRRGILSVPDFICNLGGIYGSGLAGRVRTENIRHIFTNEYSRMVERLLQRAQQAGCSPAAEATKIALENHRSMQNGSKKSGWAKMLAKNAAFALLDSPVTPGWLVDRTFHRWAQRDLCSKVK